MGYDYEFTLILCDGNAYANVVQDSNKLASEFLEYKGLSYANGVWTMNNFNFSARGSSDFACALAIDSQNGSATTITVTGTNTISSIEWVWSTNGIVINAPCTFNGTGTLTVSADVVGGEITAENCGIYCKNNTVFDGSVTVNVNVTQEDCVGAVGIKVGDDNTTASLTAKGNANVTTTATAANNSNQAFSALNISSHGSVYVNDDGSVVAAKVNASSGSAIVGGSNSEPSAVAKESSEGTDLSWTQNGNYYCYTDGNNNLPDSITLTSNQITIDYAIVLSNGKAYKYVYDAQSAPTYASCITDANIITVDGLTYADGVWTMEDFSFTTKAEYGLILDTESTITVKGTNAISALKSSGLWSVEDCAINGTGTLTVSTDSTGASLNKIAIYGNKDIVIGGDVTVNANAVLGADVSSGGVVNGIKAASLTVQGNAKVNASATNTSGAASVGSIHATDNLTVKNNATVTTSTVGNAYATTYGVHCASAPDAEAKSTSTGDTLTWNNGYKVNNTEVTALTLTEPYKDYTIVLSNGYAYKNTVDDANKITVDGLTYADGVWTMTDLSFATTAAIALQTIDATTITVTGDNYLRADCGQSVATSAMSLADGIRIIGSGTLSASASKTYLEDGKVSYGIYFQGSGTIGGSVTVNATATADKGTSAMGIFVKDTLTVKNSSQVSTTAVLSGNSTWCYQTIYGFAGDLDVNNQAKVTAEYKLDVTPDPNRVVTEAYVANNEPNASVTDTQTGDALTWDNHHYVDSNSNSVQDVTLDATQYNYTLVLYGGKAYRNISTYAGNEISAADLADMGLTYADGVWTMEDFTFNTTAARGLTSADSNITITVKGENSISVAGLNDTYETYYAGMDLSGSNVTINGTGTLNVLANRQHTNYSSVNIGIAILNSIVVCGDVTLNASAIAHENQNAHGINCCDLTVKSNAEVTSTAVREEGSGTIYGVYSDSIFEIYGNGTVRATVDEGDTSGDAASPFYSQYTTPNAAAVETQTDVELTWSDNAHSYCYSSGSQEQPTDITMTMLPVDYAIVLKNGKAYKDGSVEISTDDLADMGLTYADGVWTMSDFCFSTTASRGLEISTSDVTLNLTGTNSITCNCKELGGAAYGLIVSADCTINGTGTLAISASSLEMYECSLDSYGIYVYEDLVLDGSVTVDATAIAHQYTGNFGAYGVYDGTGSTLTVKGEAKLNASVEIDDLCPHDTLLPLSGVQPTASATDAQTGEELTWYQLAAHPHYENAQYNSLLDVTLTSLPAASITSGTSTTNYYTLAEAIAAVTEGQTIKLLQDLSDSAAISTQNGVEFAIDLNGHDYSNSAAFTNNGEITLMDSQEEGVKFSVASWINTAAANTLDIDDSLDYEAVSFSSTWTNPGTVTFDMTGATNGAYKLVDYTGTGSITSYGTVTLSNATGYTTQVINSDLYAVKTAGSVVAVNTNWTGTAIGTELTVEETTYYYGCNAFDNNAAALALDDVQSLTFADGTFDSTVSGNAPSVKILDGEYKKVLGGGIVATESSLTGSISLTIKGGEFNNTVVGQTTYTGAVVCGDGVSQGVTVQRTGNLTLSISGGTFQGVVAGGMFYCPSEYSSSGSATLNGNVAFTISGGTFNSNIYGGSLGRNADLASKTWINGQVSLTVDATSNNIAINQNLVAGSMGKGRIIDGVQVTFTGSGSNLTFGTSSVVFGGSSSDYMKKEAGKEDVDAVTYVGNIDSDGKPMEAEDRKLVFNAFTGDFGAEIRMFGAAEFTGNSNVNFTDDKIDLWAVEQWKFQAGSSASGLQYNDFTDDTLVIDLTNYDGSDWTVLEGTEEAFDGFGDFDNVTIGGFTATYYKDSNTYCAADFEAGYNYNLDLVDDKNGTYSMVLTRTKR